MAPQGREMRNGRTLIWIPKEHEVPGSAADLHRPPLPAAAPLGTGAAEEPHGPSRDSPGTDSPSTLTTARGHIPLPAQRPSMEVTTVSPSPASAIEGDDLCEIDVTNVAIHSVTLLICLCGLVGNGAVLCLLRLKRCNIDIYCLAFADFLFLLITVPSTLLFLVEDVSCSPIMPLLYVSVVFLLSVVSCYWALFLMTFRRYINYMSKFYNLCCHCDLPWWLLFVVFSVQFWAFFALFTVIPAVTNLCPSHQQEHCRAALISVFAIILLLFGVPMVISYTIDFIKAKWGSMEQQPRRRETVVFLMLLIILLLSLFNILHQLGYTVVSSEVFLLLNCIQTSMKPFIYFLAGGFPRPCSLGSLRSSLQRVFDEQKEEAAHSSDVPMDTGV
ncbi:mas-related G-protein coupled receptor member H-like isoform X2 [Sylvia atricapilla]|uniref:mas-related G-protein coupled receptor member H-like isoform X2 n=1 Tax=Sylvia atricapilla TaxID=48155 RepID=UPI00339A703C